MLRFIRTYLSILLYFQLRGGVTCLIRRLPYNIYKLHGVNGQCILVVTIDTGNDSTLDFFDECNRVLVGIKV